MLYSCQHYLSPVSTPPVWAPISFSPVAVPVMIPIPLI